jgi:hypothetical protein
MEAPLDGIHVKYNKAWHLTLDVSLSSYKLRDAKVANATAVGRWPNHLLAVGPRDAPLRVRIASINTVKYFVLGPSNQKKLFSDKRTNAIS